MSVSNPPDRVSVTSPPLVQWLKGQALARGQSVKELADELRVTEGFFLQLERGIRPIESISRALAASMGRYLRVPTDVVSLLAGQIQVSMFDAQRADTADERP
jgi:transcriptional regulator with XRE-family HTH domain